MVAATLVVVVVVVIFERACGLPRRGFGVYAVGGHAKLVGIL